jgi:hypothetical protein
MAGKDRLVQPRRPTFCQDARPHGLRIVSVSNARRGRNLSFRVKGKIKVVACPRNQFDPAAVPIVIPSAYEAQREALRTETPFPKDDMTD